MNLKLNLVKDSSNQILLQDVSNVSVGVSRVILDFVTPTKKRIELNGLTEIKAYNFVNPLVNALLPLSDTDFGQNGITPDIYEVDYSVHYPFREELFVTVGRNELYGIQMLTLLGDAEWMYIGGEYYQVIRNYSTQDYLFLDRPVTTLSTVGEIVYRDKVYFAVVNKLRDKIMDKFKQLGKTVASLQKLETLTTTTFLLIGLAENTRDGNIDMARSQMKNAKYLLTWADPLLN